MKKLAPPIIIILLGTAAFAQDLPKTAVTAPAQLKQRVAVLPSVGDLEPQGLILLTDKVREIATKNLPIGEYNILKLDAITKMIGAEELYRACKEGVCIGDLARKTDANYGARCDVIKFENNLVLKFEIYSVNEDAIFETFTDYDVKDFRGMLAVLEARLPATLQKMVYDKALADARDKAIEQQKQEAKAQQEHIPTPQLEPAKPDKPAPEPEPIVVSQAKVESVEQKPQEKQYRKSRILEKRIGVEIGGNIIPYGYGEHEEIHSYSNSTSKDITITNGVEMGVGGYLRIDLIYVEIIYDAAAVFTKEEMASKGEAGILAKYPIVYDMVKVSPIFGVGVLGVVDVEAGPWILGGRVDVGISEITYLRSEYLYGYSEGWGTSFKIGGGLDILIWRGDAKVLIWRGDAKVWNEGSNYEQPELWSCNEIYLHVEFLYNYIGGGWSDTYGDSNGEMHHLHLKLGIGYKWGSKKKPK